MKHPIYTELAKVAPSIAFYVSRQLDPNFRWDGDGPDPEDNGYNAYDVDVTATVIIQGEFIEGNASLGGSYFQSGEPNGDIHGYLLQMLNDALDELSAKITGHAAIQIELYHANAAIVAAMRREYDEQKATSY